MIFNALTLIHIISILLQGFLFQIAFKITFSYIYNTFLHIITLRLLKLSTKQSYLVQTMNQNANMIVLKNKNMVLNSK